ncbi:hypothetical protein B0A48_00218 [Cryoendolithus antarcticus]|uniref:Uncharacterized protein n=1 Tax=Cryoendolithus antarcticus TaxID=1507870 RepID=A0A1V8TTZ5_9PEZI|nr:hypothetical protein B0A48_00218 [Cryoendolithus antarcticus]
MTSTYPDPQYIGQWSIDQPPNGYVQAGPDAEDEHTQSSITAGVTDSGGLTLNRTLTERPSGNADDVAHTGSQDASSQPPPQRTSRGGVPKATPAERQKIKDRWLSACYVPRTSAPRDLRPFATDEMQQSYPPEVKMPPIIGSWLMYPNKRIKYNPFPDDIDATRLKLFKMEQPVLLKDSQEIADLLPHVTNFWRRSVGRVYVAENGTQVESWGCRSTKPMERKSRSFGNGLRVKARRVTMFEEQERCKLRLRVLSFTNHAGTGKEHAHWGVHCHCIPEWVYISRECAPDIEHTHGTAIMEKYRKSDATLYFGRLKVEEGYGYGAVEDWLRKEFSDATEQIQYVTKTDIANMTRPWRQRHPNHPLTLKVEPDTEEVSTMKVLVDAVLEAPEDDVRTVLRELCKDSEEMTNMILRMLEKCKSDRIEKAAAAAAVDAVVDDEPVEEAAQTPWQLAEGELKTLPFPGFPRKFAPSESESSGLEDGPSSHKRARGKGSEGLKSRQLPVPPNGFQMQGSALSLARQPQQRGDASLVQTAQMSLTDATMSGIAQMQTYSAYDPALSIPENPYAQTAVAASPQMEPTTADRRLSQAFCPGTSIPASSPVNRAMSKQEADPARRPLSRGGIAEGALQERPPWAQPASVVPQKQ